MKIDGYNSLPTSTRDSQNPAPAQVGTPGDPGSTSQAPTQNGSGANADLATDTVEISNQAQNLISSEQKPQAPRPEMVDYARQFLQNKMYNNEGMLEQTADHLASHLLGEA